MAKKAKASKRRRVVTATTPADQRRAVQDAENPVTREQQALRDQIRRHCGNDKVSK